MQNTADNGRSVQSTLLVKMNLIRFAKSKQNSAETFLLHSLTKNTHPLCGELRLRSRLVIAQPMHRALKGVKKCARLLCSLATYFRCPVKNNVCIGTIGRHVAEHGCPGGTTTGIYPAHKNPA
jgi:hypothetical protein